MRQFSTDDLSLRLQRVPYLNLEKAGAQRVEFLFRGCCGRAQCCALGVVIALAFPGEVAHGHETEAPLRAQIQQAHHLSLLLASSAFALDLGLQYDDHRWMFWKRFEPEAVQTPEAIFAALDEMVSIMRFLYYRCFKAPRRTGGRNKLQAAQFA